MKQPRPPIILDEHGDISAYRTVADVAAGVEAVDVINDEYQAFDAEGQPLLLHAKQWNDLVSVTVNEQSSPQPEELARRLRSYIRRVGPERLELQQPLERTPHPRLVQAVADFMLG